jgi:hypothetical protein
LASRTKASCGTPSSAMAGSWTCTGCRSSRASGGPGTGLSRMRARTRTRRGDVAPVASVPNREARGAATANLTIGPGSAPGAALSSEDGTRTGASGGPDRQSWGT